MKSLEQIGAPEQAVDQSKIARLSLNQFYPATVTACCSYCEGSEAGE
jgi:hypothetical protein